MLFSSTHTQAQQEEDTTKKDFQDITKRSALSLQLGSNTFLGDLGGSRGNGKPFIKDWDLKTTRLFTGLSYTYFLDRALSLNADVHLTSVSAADSLSNKTSGHSLGRYNRNLSFKSNIFEMQVAAELYPLQAIYDKSTSEWMPYIGTGVGIFHFNPKAQLNGVWYKLHTLHLEGQGFAEYPERSNYKLTQFYIPLTVGVKYRVNENNLVSVNTIFRITFTDYIDDVSTTYIDPQLFNKYLSPEAAVLARQLYSRSLRPEKVKPNVGKGEPDNKDNYVSMVCTLSFMLKGQPAVHYPGRPRDERW
jgi:Domain of unknown function (DUF6089)